MFVTDLSPFLCLVLFSHLKFLSLFLLCVLSLYPLCFCYLVIYFCLIFLVPFFSPIPYSPSLPTNLLLFVLIGCCSQCPSKKAGQWWWSIAHGPPWALSRSDPLQALSSPPSPHLAQPPQCCQHH